MKKFNLSKSQLISIRLLIAVLVGLLFGWFFCYIIEPSTDPANCSWEPGFLALWFFVVVFAEFVLTLPKYWWYGFISYTIAYGILLYFVCDLGLFDGYTTYLKEFDPEFIHGKGSVYTVIEANFYGWYMLFGLYVLRLMLQIWAFIYTRKYS